MATCRIPISNLPDSGSLNGSEIIPINQGLVTKKSTLNQLSGFIDLQYVTNSNNTITNNISTNKTIFAQVLSATEIHSISSFSTFTDIKQFELSGFTSTGNLNVSGDILATGGLTVDTSTLIVDSINNNVGIGTASPDAANKLEVNGKLRVNSFAAGDVGNFQIGSNGYASTTTDFNVNDGALYVDADARKVSIGFTTAGGGTEALTVNGNISASDAGIFDTLNVNGASSTGSINADGNITAVGDIFTNKITGREVNDSLILESDPEAPDGSNGGSQIELYSQDFSATPSQAYYKARFHTFQDLSGNDEFIIGPGTVKSIPDLTVMGDISATGKAKISSGASIFQNGPANAPLRVGTDANFIGIDSNEIETSTGLDLNIRVPSDKKVFFQKRVDDADPSTTPYSANMMVIDSNGEVTVSGDILTDKITGREVNDSLILESDPEAPDGSNGGSQIELYSQDFVHTPSQIYHKARFHTFQDLSGNNELIIGPSQSSFIGNISATGTVNIDNNTMIGENLAGESVFTVDVSENRVGINKDTPAATLHIVNETAAGGAGSNKEALRVVGQTLLTTKGDTNLVIQGQSDNSGNDDEPLIKLRRGTTLATEGLIGVVGESVAAKNKFIGAIPEAIYIQAQNADTDALSAENIQFAVNEKIGLTIKGSDTKDVKIGIGTEAPSEKVTIAERGESAFILLSSYAESKTQGVKFAQGVTSTDAVSTIGELNYYDQSNTESNRLVAQIVSHGVGATPLGNPINTNAGGQLTFSTKPDGGTLTEVLKITDTGRLNIANIPTSPSGLSSGDIYSDGGTLKIVS